MLLGILFGVVILLNFARGRFWCRYICPLGGLLGIVGKNPVVRIKVDADKCTKCMACVSVCPTGAEPESDGSWRAGECIYCWNCEGICPVDAISFKFMVAGGGEER
jgi:polyferredoxin